MRWSVQLSEAKEWKTQEPCKTSEEERIWGLGLSLPSPTLRINYIIGFCFSLFVNREPNPGASFPNPKVPSYWKVSRIRFHFLTTRVCIKLSVTTMKAWISIGPLDRSAIQ